MNHLTRRDFTRRLAAAAGATAAATTMGDLLPAFGAATGSVVVVGGGFGGASCANFLGQYAPQLEVTLIEPRSRYTSCCRSSAVIAGIDDIAAITYGYEQLKARRGCQILHERVVAIEPTSRTIRLQGGTSLPYDRLVVAPGISFDWQQLDGSGEQISERIPHAWMTGEQTIILRDQLRDMPDGGVVILSVPRKPFRAPPAMLERASFVAHYLKQNKPRSKILLLDPNEGEPQLELFRESWSKLYPGMIERISGTAASIARLDAAELALHSSSGDVHRGAVLNVVPAQRAGQIALDADLADASGWCPVDQRSFESARHPHVHVIGDACLAGDLPKTGFAANLQAKICAAAIIASFNGDSPPAPVYFTALYSLIEPRQAISEVYVYRLVDGQISRISGGVSEAAAPRRIRLKEAEYAAGWYKAVTAEMFAL